MPSNLVRDHAEHGLVVSEIDRRVAESVIKKESEPKKGDSEENAGTQERERPHPAAIIRACALRGPRLDSLNPCVVFLPMLIVVAAEELA
jgi:hypothetical protein